MFSAFTLTLFRKILRLCWLCFVSVVFFAEFVENERVFAEEDTVVECIEHLEPKTRVEVFALRACLRKLNFENRGASNILSIRKSYEGSLKLTEKLRLIMNKGSSKKQTENPLKQPNDGT
ncbi:MAG: hypothetical protein ISR93_10350 [SAR324 cluster bacterium]|nr:hypothetical protein [SAR324 cluster bacterium]